MDGCRQIEVNRNKSYDSYAGGQVATTQIKRGGGLDVAGEGVLRVSGGGFTQRRRFDDGGIEFVHEQSYMTTTTSYLWRNTQIWHQRQQINVRSRRCRKLRAAEEI